MAKIINENVMDKMEHATSILLNFTWILFLICIACVIVVSAFEMIEQLKTKRILDEEIFGTMKEYANIFSDLSEKINHLRNDIDNLGKKVREIEARKYN